MLNDAGNGGVDSSCGGRADGAHRDADASPRCALLQRSLMPSPVMITSACDLRAAASSTSPY
jgi:hypothetical protein